MSRTETAITNVAPSWLKAHTEDDKSTEALREYRVMARMRQIQGLSPQTLKDTFGEGSAVIFPGNAMICDATGSFLVVPLFTWTEFITWNDRNDKGNPAIRAKSFDKQGEIAIKSRSADDRMEVYPEGGGPKNKPYMIRHVEHINFACVIYGDHPASGTPVSMSFSKGEFFQGRNFSSAILLRKIDGETAPLWSQVWRFHPAQHKNQSGNVWWGLDFSIPEQPWIHEHEVMGFKSLHDEFRQLHEKQLLDVNREDADEGVDEEMVDASFED